MLGWNVRGLTDETKLLLKEHCASFSPLVVGILEPKMAFHNCPASFWRSLNVVPCHQNSRVDMCSNIWVFVHPVVSVRIELSTDQVVLLSCVWLHHNFRVAVVHGSNSHIERRTLWLDLLNYFDGQTVFIGDFNAVKGAHERISTRLPNAAACREFNDFIAATGFVEPQTSGLRFTWSGRRFMPSHVESVLDRAIVSTSFSDSWQSITSHALPRVTSDHAPLVLICCQAQQTSRRFFKFLHMWTSHPDFESFVENSWRDPMDTRCPIYRVMFKLKRLRKELQNWNRTVFGNVDISIATAQQELLEIQAQISQEGYTDALFDAEVLAQAKINVSLSRKSSLLRQKCRVKWLHDGDRNNSFFHSLLRYKKRSYMIAHLEINNQMVYDQDEIGGHIVQFFTSLFAEDQTAEVDIVQIEAVIDHKVSSAKNALLSRIPDQEEITAAVFDMDPHSAAGPDGFCGRFYHACWSIIKQDIWEAVRNFFVASYLPTGCNSNTLILIPKKETVNSVADLRPIVLSNFLFKIISKVLATRLSGVAAEMVSKHQYGFVRGRSIHDCIMLGSEGVNCLKRSHGGVNMACKIDIRKAFDTLRWDFLLKVLRAGGYSETFIRWIAIILRSARLSILYNSNLCGYFQCSRGVRQGDPLSPILFGIAEDVLSVLFQNCVDSGNLVPMKLTRGTAFPTHLLYADDILVFGRATTANARKITHILEFYGSISGQICSMEKSHVYFGDKTPNRLRRHIINILNFRKGSLPFNYLGVPIFSGRVKASFLRAIHDRIILKFARWKGMQLSMAGRICLVKSVIQSSITHSMMVYRWPRSLIKDLDLKCRNFIWTGDVSKRPSCPVSWARVCAIKEEGGLGIRSFDIMNKSYLMKMAWNIIGGHCFSHQIMRSRYLTPLCRPTKAAASSIWLGLRQEIPELLDEAYCYVGAGTSINFWKDDWLGYSLVKRCGVSDFLLETLTCSVADYYYEGIWHFTQNFLNVFPEIICDILLLPVGEGSDDRFWKSSVHGTVSAAAAFSKRCHGFPIVKWGSWIWENFIPVRRSLLCWRLIHNRLPTFDCLIKQGLILPNFCCFCYRSGESIDHLFWQCSELRHVWEEFLNWFNFNGEHVDIHGFLVAAWNHKPSSQVLTYWKAGIIYLLWAIWHQRNECVFKGKVYSSQRLLQHIRVAFKEVEANFSKLGCMNNSWSDYLIIRRIGVATRASPPPIFVNVHWWPPILQWIKVNTDGSTLGAPGKIAAGGVFRDNHGCVRGCFHQDGGKGFAFEAELLAVILAIQIAHERNWRFLWVESDSTYIVNLFGSRDYLVPWRFVAAWKKTLGLLRDFNLQVTHIYREGNKPADIMASEVVPNGWWLHAIEAIKTAVGLDMASHSHVRLRY
ncbi:uncharacterized protein LOC131008273 [Salvia miltiorrhiza]|uniref:uncharacterized protein LOC131008273 n=1 Tax=Salvia miltiorrhiza TaxID=226208 RepID=UPI0025AD3C41|nr:uncharacterized protein LOC131008273 [Salvia miltiorrhiza]